MSSSHIANTLKYWRAIETFNMPDLPAVSRHPDKKWTPLQPGSGLPWEQGEFDYAQSDKRWRHTLYFCPLPKETVIQQLERLVSSVSKDYREPLSGNTFLAAIVVDQQGKAIERSYARASFPYGMKILKKKGKPDELNDLLKKAYTDYSQRFGTAEKQPVQESAPIESGEPEEPRQPEVQASPRLTWAQLQKELDDLHELASRLLPIDTSIICISEEAHEKAAFDPPFMNSFYLNDLNGLINDPKNYGRPLEQYISAKVYLNDRVNLLTPESLFASINPKFHPPGRWPSPPEHGLYSAQLAALNLSLSNLQQQPGLWGINGPPGTGKTTLLREIIADAIIRRAKRLAVSNPEKLFEAKRKEIAQYCEYFTYNEKVTGNDGILVASNNNGAVENLSRELPALKSIDSKTFAEANYFADTAWNLLQEGPCWAMISAVLGNAANRNQFNNRFWFDRDKGFKAALNAGNTPQQKQQYIDRFKTAAKELTLLLDEYQEFNQLAKEHYDILYNWLKKGPPDTSIQKKWRQLNEQLITQYQIFSENLPGPDFLQQSLETIHKTTPYSSKKLNHLKSSIFLKSLQLHEYAILANAKSFRANLNAFVDMLAGKHPEKMTPDVRETLWGTFFFCVPMASATLASIERLFVNMGKGSIGWLLLDEAGQASPASACGAIWRAQRSILIGDTLQIPPVVTIPEGLARLLQDQYGLEDSCWSPLRSSAQTLADRITPIGSYILIAETEVWTGTPLRAHRRCQEPMFSIANGIAYNNQMVKLTTEEEDPSYPASCWIDVRGMTVTDRHVVKEEIDTLQQMLAVLLQKTDLREVFVISPFRAVAKHCRENLKGNKQFSIKSGTIHTFQGKETDVVFLVLGSDQQNYRARQWVSETPNMLNVAVTRAKKRLYVIGNRQTWGDCRYFNDLKKTLRAARL